MPAFHRLRCSVVAWQLSEAQAKASREGEWGRVAYLRRALKDPDRRRSAVRAVGEFCPESVARRLLAAAEFREYEPVVDFETGGDSPMKEGDMPEGVRSWSWCDLV